MEPLPAAPPEGGGPALLSAAPETYFLAGACVLRPGACVLLPSARPPLQVLRRRLPLHRTSSRAAEARTVAAAAAPRSPPGAASPGDTFPASVCLRPAARPSAPAAGPECRPEAWPGHGSLAGRVSSGPRLSYPLAEIRGALGVHSWADWPPLNSPEICQRHSNILSV